MMKKTTGHQQQTNPHNGGKFGEFHGVQPERDLEANWEVDLAKKLEDYLFKICSGEITGSQDDGVHSSVNFAEAALLLQGSVQVYSRKVEYLYNLVLHTLEFLSQKRQHDQPDGASSEAEQSASHASPDEDHANFWVLDDIPVEAKISLDNSSNKDDLINQFVKPPANLVVLEGDCLDISGDGNELESYLLATNDLYQDFILLDPYDAAAVDVYLKGDDTCKGEYGTNKGTSRRKTFQSPTGCSGGTARKSSQRKNKDTNVNQTPRMDYNSGVNDCNMGAGPSTTDDFGNVDHGFDMDDRYSEPRDLDNSDDDDDNDPWKPLNPHEAGNLKVRPFKKVKPSRKSGVNSKKCIPITALFPLARLHGTISPQLTEMWERQQNNIEKQRESKPPPLYEKLRQSLIGQGAEAANTFANFEEDNEDNVYHDENADFGGTDFDMPENIPMDEDLPLKNEKHENGDAELGKNEMFDNEDPCSQESLEDLCRSHLDALLASIAENEKQTELAARVSSWKQKIEDNLEEQDSHPPFDIHEYGDRILDKLSLEADKGDFLPFGDLVKGQEKHDVARSFSALLQLVNNGDVGLNRSGLQGESVCYTDENPFHVQLLKHEKRVKTQFQMPKKRGKPSSCKKPTKRDRNISSPEKCLPINMESDYGSAKLSSQPNCKASFKLGKLSGVRCTPESKRRRRF